MNILILSASHPYKTAGVAALDIYRGFKSRDGFNVRMVVRYWDKYPDSNIRPVESYFNYLKGKGLRKFQKLLSKWGILKINHQTSDPDYHIQDFDQTKSYYSTKKILSVAGIDPDVIFIIFPQRFINYQNIFELNKLTGAPIYWQLGDMAPFTGLCHYAWECEGYKLNCGKCPAIWSDDPVDISYINLNHKKKYLNDTRLRVLIGSEWLFSRAKNSSLFQNKPISKVYMSIDEGKFHPIDDLRSLREKWTLPVNATVIGFGANFLNEKRKGIHLILEAINLIQSEGNLVFLYAGDQPIHEEMNLPMKYAGRLDRDQLPDFYRVCDFFLSASLQDVGPYMIVEALMCGVPVVSFDTGIARDYIISDETGMLVEEITSTGLAKGIQYLLDKKVEEVREMKKACYERTRVKVTLNRQIDSYIELFKEDKLTD